jgi:hypothetical protein
MMPNTPLVQRLFTGVPRKSNSRKSVCHLLLIVAPMRLENGLLSRPSTAGRPQDVGVLDSYAPQCNTRITKRYELAFRAILGDGTPEVWFEWATS